jgi:hypothetical protein
LTPRLTFPPGGFDWNAVEIEACRDRPHAGGDSQVANLALFRNNARVAAQVAAALQEKDS